MDSGLLTPESNLFYFVSGLLPTMRQCALPKLPTSLRLSHRGPGDLTPESRPVLNSLTGKFLLSVAWDVSTLHLESSVNLAPSDLRFPDRTPDRHSATMDLHLWGWEPCALAQHQHASTTTPTQHPAAVLRDRETDKPGGGGSGFRVVWCLIPVKPTWLPAAGLKHWACPTTWAVVWPLQSQWWGLECTTTLVVLWALKLVCCSGWLCIVPVRPSGTCCKL